MVVKGKILIVDDEPINLDFFDVMLSRLGFEIDKAEDGEEALEKIVENKPDLIILDNIMPKLTGWELTKILKREEEYIEYRDIPIIMFSAMDDVKDKIEGFELGVADYITKPFNFSEVLARIQAVLRNKELSTQVLYRERRITLVESLNKSLVYFTQHLKQPVLDLLEAANKLDAADKGQVEHMVELVRNECEETLATLSGLEDEIKELQGKGDELKQSEISIQDLEDKFQKHFKGWKDGHKKLDEVAK